MLCSRLIARMVIAISMDLMNDLSSIEDSWSLLTKDHLSNLTLNRISSGSPLAPVRYYSTIILEPIKPPSDAVAKESIRNAMSPRVTAISIWC